MGLEYLIAQACISALVVGLQASDGNWGAATAGAGGGLSVFASLAKKKSDERLSCCKHQIKQLEKSLADFAEAEGMSSNERDSLFADLKDFAPIAVDATRVTAHDLANWQNEKRGALANQAVEIALSKLHLALPKMGDDETQKKFKEGDIRHSALCQILHTLYANMFAMPDPVHEVMLCEIQAGREESQGAHAKTHEGIDELKGGPDKILKGMQEMFVSYNQPTHDSPSSIRQLHSEASKNPNYKSGKNECASCNELKKKLEISFEENNNAKARMVALERKVSNYEFMLKTIKSMSSMAEDEG